MSFSARIFFDELRKGLLGPALDAGEVSGCEAILQAMQGAPLPWAAYALATAYHETASTMQPIREYGGASYFRRRYDIAGANPALARRLGNAEPGDGARYAGRGYVQLTGRANYTRAGRKLGVDLISDPDRALDVSMAAEIMRRGMTDGWFTGKSFAHYLPAGAADRVAFGQARRIVNGIDRAALVAGYAMQFQDALAKAGWS